MNRSKHIDAPYHFVHELFRSNNIPGAVDTWSEASEDQQADMLTNALATGCFKAFSRLSLNLRLEGDWMGDYVVLAFKDQDSA